MLAPLVFVVFVKPEFKFGFEKEGDGHSGVPFSQMSSYRVSNTVSRDLGSECEAEAVRANADSFFSHTGFQDFNLADVAREVAMIIQNRLTAGDLVRMCGVVFLDVTEAADFLRVKPKTVSTWISQGKVPVRYAGGRPLFLLAELLLWTLPEPDPHSPYRLVSSAACKIALDRLATNRERKGSDVGL